MCDTVAAELSKVGECISIPADQGTEAGAKPWRVRTVATDRVDLVFKPEFERAGWSGRREGWFTEVHQMFGRYSGRIVPDDGPPIAIKDLFGWIEEHEARW